MTSNKEVSEKLAQKLHLHVTLNKSVITSQRLRPGRAGGGTLHPPPPAGGPSEWAPSLRGHRQEADVSLTDLAESCSWIRVDMLMKTVSEEEEAALHKPGMCGLHHGTFSYSAVGVNVNKAEFKRHRGFFSF